MTDVVYGPRRRMGYAVKLGKGWPEVALSIHAIGRLRLMMTVAASKLENDNLASIYRQVAAELGELENDAYESDDGAWPHD